MVDRSTWNCSCTEVESNIFFLLFKMLKQGLNISISQKMKKLRTVICFTFNYFSKKILRWLKKNLKFLQIFQNLIFTVYDVFHVFMVTGKLECRNRDFLWLRLSLVGSNRNFLFCRCKNQSTKLYILNDKFKIFSTLFSSINFLILKLFYDKFFSWCVFDFFFVSCHWFSDS